ncbi:MAG: hypothetical protein RL514_1092 [Verrucomicrobiota bacterium]|jgi:hypothetical protein
MKRILFLLTALVVAFGPTPLPAAAAPPARSCFLIGNSLTWDTLPERLDGDVQWHVDCGTPLPVIHQRPDKPCVTNSTLWPKALKAKQYDLLSIQPHYGDFAENVAVISQWIATQPKAVIIIHTGWAKHAERVEEYALTEMSGPLKHSPAHLQALLAELRRRHPGREIRQTHAQELLEHIARDIAAKRAPFGNLQELYRDEIHLQVGPGRYLMHNAMRRALGQPPSAKGFEKLDAELKRYLDQVLATLR